MRLLAMTVAMEWGIRKPSDWDELSPDDQAEMMAVCEVKWDMQAVEMQEQRRESERS
jgi:hypothetical protein